MMAFDPQPDAQPSPAPLRGDIAIVGMGCLFAGAPDLDTYWRNILSKVDAISDPPSNEWDPKLFYDPESKSNDRVYCKRGGYIGDLASFRPLDFGVMPVTVDGGEPDQWLALRVAHEALADAGYKGLPKEHIRTEVVLGKGTYVNRGNLTVGYHGMIVEHFLQALKNLHPEYTDSEINEIKKELKAGLPPFSADTAPALIGNIIAGRIANRLDLMGPSFTVDAACASALLAIEIGVRDLLSHKYDLVLAGGANVNAPLPTMSLFCQLGALSRREQIRPFDKKADGTILGEGLGMVVLKRRQDAERDGNRIYAVIKGVGVASDGRALHVMAPRVEGEELALRRAYEMAGVTPQSVGLIEAHGTATPVGDVVEIQALSRVFGERQGLLPSCALGSVKSMIGHTMPAAGIAGVIKTALALYHRILPPTLNCEEPNPALRLDQTPLYVNTETRAWIHGADTPRRAGVNSFGFGGINAHVVLEEHPAEVPDAPSPQLHWETEVCILEAESRSGLIDRAAKLKTYLEQPAPAPLKDLAFSLNTRLEGKTSRLSVIASSASDLAQKLGLALARLADPKCAQIKDNAGIYFFDKPLEGKLAFLFPGEGAQYPNMLHDLCLHFPEVRRCFDRADRALLRGKASIPPSEFIFPRSILSDAERAEVERTLWGLDGAVAAVLIGNYAMWTLLQCLRIEPDRIVGHSTGDYSAMFASGIVEIPRDAEVETILAWSKAHAELVERVAVPDAMLVAVAADAAAVMPIVESIGGELYLAMDNCPHQSVLVGTRAAVDQAVEQLRRQGIIYETLPFDRPYHTPMFRAYAEGTADAFFARVRVNAPATETYSCTTAARYPADAEEIRRLFIDHWVGPVRFTETVHRMYDDGVRLFVEAGPRGNLTAFVSDILRGRPHLAMPANVSRRSGITQINHLVGVLAAQGVGMEPGYLYARRDAQLVPWETAKTAAPAKGPAPMKLSLALPPLTLAPRQPRPAIAAAPPRRDDDLRIPHRDVPTMPPPPAAPRNGVPAAVAVAPAPAPVHAPASRTSSAAVMQEYFKGMENFLDVETEVMGAFLKRRPGPATNANSAAASAPAQGAFPLLGTITALVPGRELSAVRTLSQEEDLFLRDHALGGPVSLTDPGLRPLIVLPLTMSMEILAEAGAALMPGRVLVGMRDIQAHHWIQVDEAPVGLQISAQCLAGSAKEVSVQVRNPKVGPAPVIEGIMIFGDEYPAPPPPSATPLTAERPSKLASADLYDGRLMFHGPAFQGVVRVDRSGQNGLLGQLRTLPVGNLLRSTAHPKFVTDPVVLDAAGQLVGFWAAEYLSRGFVVFPYHLDRLTIYGPNPSAGQDLACRLTVQSTANDSMRSDIEVAGPGGAVWLRLQGWADRRFDPPERFHRAWISPGEAMISEPWPSPVANTPGVECCRVDSLFGESSGLWKDLWASLVLTARERRQFAERRGPEHRQLEWLAGRTAAKDAVRTYLRKHNGLQLLPADIEIAPDEHGKPLVAGPWTQQLRAVPHISITHSENVAVALAYDPAQGLRCGIDIQAVRVPSPDFETSLLTAPEQRQLDTVPQAVRDEWILRLWCVKEAVSKALGRGLVEGPSSVRILSLDSRTGVVAATPQGQLAAAVPEASGQRIVAYTGRERAHVFATAIFETRTS